ncbi:hypothetical protein DYD21_01375 [Rhodohalobacter sp. SW132]|nr:hypothetical protein DYD21_01375 [Rhodohalobacter sp. SW132]
MQGAGCRVQGAGCRVQGAGCRVQGAGCRVQGAGRKFDIAINAKSNLILKIADISRLSIFTAVHSLNLEAFDLPLVPCALPVPFPVPANAGEP